MGCQVGKNLKLSTNFCLLERERDLWALLLWFKKVQVIHNLEFLAQ